MATQKSAIVDYLHKHGSITPMQAFKDLGITKLATRIGELKKDGLGVKTETVPDRNRYGKQIYYCKYSLTEEQA